MRFAPVSPTSALYYLPHTGYHLALSNQLLAGQAAAQFYRNQAAEGSTVIIDHPVHERLPVPSLEQILALTVTVKPTAVVVPDVIGDPEATLRKFEELQGFVYQAGSKPLAVVQGKNATEYRQAIEALAPRAVYIGIPLIRIYEQIDRADFIIQLTNDGFFDKYPHVRIHLLGADRWMNDAFLLRAHRSVIGIDSAKPVYLALKGIDISRVHESWGRPTSFFATPEHLCVKHRHLIEHNVNWASSWVGSAIINDAKLASVREYQAKSEVAP